MGDTQMGSIPIFYDSWYPERISAELEGSGRLRDALVVANAIMVAGAFIAQAIDHASGGDQKGETPFLGGVTTAIGRLAAAIEDMKGGG